MPIPKKKVVSKKEEIMENEDLMDEEDEVMDTEDEDIEDVDITEEIDEDTEEEDFDEIEEDEVEEEPAPKKVVKKAPAKKTVSKKAAPKKEETKKTSAKKATKPVEKKEEVKKSTKPAPVKEEEKKEKTYTKADISNVSKLIKEAALNRFNESFDNGIFDADISKKTSATRNEVVKLFINMIHEAVNSDESSGRIANIIDLSNVTIANATELFGLFERTFMELVETETTFYFGTDPSTGSMLAIKRRPFDANVKSINGYTKYIAPHSKMLVSYDIGKTMSDISDYDKETGIVTLADGKKVDINKANAAWRKTDMKKHSRNYPPHLYKGQK